MEALFKDLCPLGDPSSEDLAGISLDLYKEKIRVKYLEEGCTQKEILEWLNNDQPFIVKSNQLTRQLGKWDYFKNRSYLRPQRIRSKITQVTRQVTKPRRASFTGLPTNSYDQLVDTGEGNELGELVDSQSTRAAVINKRSPSSVSSKGNSREGRRTIDDPPLAASVTSSQLTGLHSFRSMQRRLQHSKEEYIQGTDSFYSVSADAFRFYDLHLWYDEEVDFSKNMDADLFDFGYQHGRDNKSWDVLPQTINPSLDFPSPR